MNRKLPHIAIVLIWIFIYPVIFHSVHIVRHHSHKTHKTYHITGDSVDGISSPGKSKTNCPVYKYKFSVQNLSGITVSGSKIFILDACYRKTLLNQHTSCIVYTKSSRAPPANLI